MPVSVVGTPNNTNSTSVSPSVTFTGYTPLAGDCILFFCSAAAVDSVLAMPTGWVNPLGAGGAATSSAHTLGAAYHFVTQAEADAVTLTYTITNFWNATATGGNIHAVAFRYVYPADPNDRSQTTINSTATTPHVLAALTGSFLQSGNQIVSCELADVSCTYTTPSGWTQQLAGSTSLGKWTGTRDALTQAGVSLGGTNITPSVSSRYASITIALTAYKPLPLITENTVAIRRVSTR